jgi:2-keto-4-pentenoate hydratase/2-oxohepta-3-ene-1,7-dioic acid hydratase in catechol pathway
MMPDAAGKSMEQITAEMRAGGHWGCWKITDDVAGPDDEVPHPRRAAYLDYEGELAVVIGAPARDVAAKDIDSLVWGVTLLNDWSIRDTGERPRFISYNLAKNFDRSVSLGPSILLAENGIDDFTISTTVNGQLRQSYSTGSMVFSFGEILEWLTRDLTFVPGDIIGGGTGAGTAADRTPSHRGDRSHELFLKPGDVVEVSSPPIGVLRNTVGHPTSPAESQEGEWLR